MSKQLIGYEMQNAIISRLTAAAAFQEALTRAAPREAALHEALLALAPEPLRGFIEEEDVINTLFRHGRYSTHLYFERLGLGGLVGTKKAVAELNRAWAKQVTVRLGNAPEPYRVDIIFGVAQL